MAGEYVENPVNVFHYDADWLETSSDQQAGSGNFTLETQENTRTGIIPWNKLRSAMRYFLGYASCDAASPYLLHRENPSPDPVFPWLYCYSFHFQGIGPLANSGKTGTYVDSPFYTTPDQLAATQYQKAMVTVGYRAHKYRFLPDAAIATPYDEWMRNCFVEGDAQLDVLTADGVGQLIFAEHNVGPPLTGPPTIGSGGTPFPAPVPTLLAKGNYVINWYGVPVPYLSNDADVFNPQKILNGLGKVNSTDFMVGDVVPVFPKGCALMKGVRWQIFPWPVAAANVGEILLGANVQIMVEYFDPPQGVPGSVYAGHNLMPYRGVSGDPTGGKFFYATRGGLTTDPPLLPGYDFNNIWFDVNTTPF